MAANVIVPVRGVSCIYVCREWLQVSQQVIVPVRGVSCIGRLQHPTAGAQRSSSP